MPASTKLLARHRTTLVRSAIAAAIVLPLGWVTLGVTAAQVIGRGNPQAALAWWPFDAQAREAQAAQTLTQPRPNAAALARAVDQARASLRRSPANTEAARTLALLTALQGDEPGARRLMAYAERMSRRDMPTQLWLIEAGVRNDDIPDALLHYDRALATSPRSGEALFPLLIAASDDPKIRAPLMRLLATRPPWWRDFAARLASEGNSGPAIYDLISALKLNGRDPLERGTLAAAIGRTAAKGSPELAFKLYAKGLKVQPGLLRDGSFEDEILLPPIDWALNSEGDFSATISRGDEGSGNLLFVGARTRGTGEVARQLLMLPAGSYRLTLRVGNVSSDQPSGRPQVRVTCQQGGQQILADQHLPKVPPSGTRAAAAFTVPAGCSSQVLSIIANGNSSSAEDSWIDDIAITRG